MQAASNARQKPGRKEKAAQAVAADDTLRATQVLGRKVIDSSNALILGYVDEIYFSFETRQMVALRVRAYFKARLLALLKGHKSRWVVPMQIVHKIGAYAVVIDREQAGIPVDPARPTEAEKKWRSQQKPPPTSASLHGLVGRQVVSDEGELLGKLNDVLLSDDNPLMRGFEINTGSGLMNLLGVGDHTQHLSARARALGDVLLVPARSRLVLTSPSIPAVQIRPAAPEPLPATPEPPENPTPDWLC
ncbi:MAG TPA: PRC-barrel domain-containing protein [Ktedonobacterales bacterium]|jgi:sporulation protein YlmC with PRC-barrel domain